MTITPTSEFQRSIPPQLMSRMMETAQERRYPPGAVLFAEGSFHDDFHLIVEGHVQLEMAVPQRGRIPLLTAGPGDILAWSTLLAHGRMTSTATALEPVRTLAYHGEKLRTLCDEQPEIGYHLMKQLATALSRRLLATRLQVLDLFAGHAPLKEAGPVFGKPGDPEC